MKTKRIAYLGLLIALAFILSYVEAMLPFQLGIPGAKIGLANLAVIVALYTLGERDAVLLSLLRIVLVGFSFGSLSAMLYSFAGAVLSLAVMVFAKKRKIFSITGVSVLGGVFHNVGQILVAILVLETKALLTYLPVLLLTGCLSGAVIGLMGGRMTERIKKR